jgi:hypothetical protein
MNELKRRGQGDLVSEGWTPEQRPGTGTSWDYPGRAAELVVASETVSLPEGVGARAEGVLSVFLEVMESGLGGLIPGEMGQLLPGPPGRLEMVAAQLDEATGGSSVGEWLTYAEAVAESSAAPPESGAPPTVEGAGNGAPLPPAPPAPPVPTGAPASRLDPSALPPWAASEARRLIARNDPLVHQVAALLPGLGPLPPGNSAPLPFAGAPWFHAAVGRYLVAVRSQRAQKIQQAAPR